jgi:hypothetical protein
MDQPQTTQGGQLPILKIPLVFYGLPSDPSVPRRSGDITRLDEYVVRLTEELKVQITKAQASNATSIPDDLYRAVKTMPAAMFRLPDEYEVPIGLFTILNDHVYYVYSAYKAGSVPDPHLEQLLSGYPEYIYYLLKAETGQGGVLSQTQENSVRSMFNNPFWAIKWLEHHYSDTMYKEMLRNIFNLKDHDACSAHCYHWLKTRNQSPEVKKEELAKMLSVFGNQPYIAIITALEFPDVAVEPLLTEVQHSPMWTYNWLRLVRNRGESHKMIQNLLTWIPWGIQYIHDVNPPDAPELLEQIKRKPKNPWWDEWLDIYLQKRKQNRT